MRAADFEEFARAFQDEMLGILMKKGPDYSTNEDRLANFRRIGYALTIPDRYVWAVYAQKHMDALLTWARTGKVSSEALRGRFLDLANYCILGAALAEEAVEA